MSGYCEWPQFYAEDYRRARKPHRCVECKAKIQPGERYLRYSGKWDGEVNSGNQHLLCRAACMWIRDRFQEGECIGFGELREYYYEFASWGKAKPEVKVFRRMIARIKWRERRVR